MVFAQKVVGSQICRSLRQSFSSCAQAPATTVIVALSGGVDSSVAAALLKDQLHDTTNKMDLQAVHMTNWNFHDDDDVGSGVENICYEQDYKDAVAVADHLDISVTRQRLEAEYWTHVFEPYLEDLIQNGNMGNPDINCNVYIKFGALRQNVLSRFGSNTWLATGHYARLWHSDATLSLAEKEQGFPLMKDYSPLVEEQMENKEDDWLWNYRRKQQSATYDKPWLLAANDLSKDQSYFLSGCSSSQLRQVLFPLGDLHKKNKNMKNRNDGDDNNSPKTVRDIAAEKDLPTAQKRESMGICFIGKRKSWKEFVQGYLPKQKKKVDFVDIDTGKVMAQSAEPSHPSLYTAGRGAKIGGTAERYFVVAPPSASTLVFTDKYPATKNDNVVWVCAGTHHPALYADIITVFEINWIIEEIPEKLMKKCGVLRCQCRVRHLQELTSCEVVRNENDVGDTYYTIHLDQPIRAIMPGQMLALYAVNGLVCLGGGPISSRGPSRWEQGRSI